MKKKYEEKYLKAKRDNLLYSISLMPLEFLISDSIDKRGKLCLILQQKVFDVIKIDDKLEELRKRRIWL